MNKFDAKWKTCLYSYIFYLKQIKSRNTIIFGITKEFKARSSVIMVIVCVISYIDKAVHESINSPKW